MVAAAEPAFLALARHDTAAALRAFATQPDSFDPGAFRLDYARLLAARGLDHQADSLFRLGYHVAFYRGPSDPLWELLRGRVSERLGQREDAIEAYSLVTGLWRHPDPELEPYVEEARTALARLTSEPRR